MGGPKTNKTATRAHALLLGDQGSFRTLLKAGLAETIGTAVFVYLATGSVASSCHTQDIAQQSGSSTALTNVVPGSCFLSSSNLLLIAFSFGLTIGVMVYATASFSGGHLNPAITLAFLVARKISLVKAIMYIALQMGGACAGSALVKAIDANGYRGALGAANRLNDGIEPVNAWGTETILTFVLVFVVFAATDSKRAAGNAHLPVLAPLAIGLTVFLCHLVAVPLDGCSINPARSFGVAAVSVEWAHQWIFWVGPLGGALAATVLYEVFLRTHEKRNTVHHPGNSTHGRQKVHAVMPAYAGEQGMHEREDGDLEAGRPNTDGPAHAVHA